MARGRPRKIKETVAENAAAGKQGQDVGGVATNPEVQKAQETFQVKQAAVQAHGTSQGQQQASGHEAAQVQETKAQQ
ncbi:hypothetical protein FJZ26_03200 [Candidatus Parvarchaeota archaeon]|nr:hypothetical protein [Candidatus Parvarchaeota archaeon]